MPYIKNNIRVSLREAPEMIENAGELNYSFTMVILNYTDNKKLSYATINDIMGALEGAKLEFYRRVVVPYEEKKMKENGDVYNE